jgi:DNA-binding SARP family transcriptional activator
MGDAALTGPPTQRRRLALLAMLAVAGEKGISRDKLLGVLWPEGETEKARHALNQILSAQRRHFANAQLFDGNKTVRLNRALITSDVGEFQEAVAAGDVQTAHDLYSGPFLDGFFLQGSTEFEKWSSDQRARLADLLADALDSAADNAHESGDHNSAVRWRRRCAELDRTDAGRALRLADSLVRAANRPAALRALHDCQKRISEELGISGDPEIARRIASLTVELTGY